MSGWSCHMSIFHTVSRYIWQRLLPSAEYLPRDNGHQWTRQGGKALRRHACIVHPTPSRSHHSELCSSLRILLDGFGRSFEPVHISQRLFSPREGRLCKSPPGQIPGQLMVAGRKAEQCKPICFDFLRFSMCAQPERTALSKYPIY